MEPSKYEMEGVGVGGEVPGVAACPSRVVEPACRGEELEEEGATSKVMAGNGSVCFNRPLEAAPILLTALLIKLI